MHTFTLILISLLVLVGCASHKKRFTEQDVNNAALRGLVAHRNHRAITHIGVLEQLRSGSITNAIKALETDLARDIDQLRTVLRQLDPTNGHRGQIQHTLRQYDEYRVRHPVTQP
jgi:predicted ABC-class ATPase